jgi:putative SOS response-associated peptidase YedK
MPVALVPEVWSAWLDRDMREPERALELIQPIDSELLMEHEVSRKVNDVRNNGPELIASEAQQRLI